MITQKECTWDQLPPGHRCCFVGLVLHEGEASVSGFVGGAGIHDHIHHALRHLDHTCTYNRRTESEPITDKLLVSLKIINSTRTLQIHHRYKCFFSCCCSRLHCVHFVSKFKKIISTNLIDFFPKVN